MDSFTNPIPWPTQYVSSCLAPSCPIAAWSATFLRAGSLTIVWRGIGSGSGASLPSHASTHGDVNCLECFPVLLFDLTVWLDDAATNFSLILSDVSASVVGRKTEAHHTPSAPIAITPAICSPVQIPPAASIGTSPYDLRALLTSGTKTIVETLPQWPPPSVPDTTIISTPASACLTACCFAPTSAATGTLFCFPISNIHFGGTPNAFATSLIGWEKATSSTSLAPSSPAPKTWFELCSIFSEASPPLKSAASISCCSKMSARNSLCSWGIIALKSSVVRFSPLPTYELGTKTSTP